MHTVPAIAPAFAPNLEGLTRPYRQQTQAIYGRAGVSRPDAPSALHENTP